MYEMKNTTARLLVGSHIVQIESQRQNKKKTKKNQNKKQCVL